MTQQRHLISEMTPMQAMATLYGDGHEDASRELVDGLGWQIFEGPERRPLGGLRRAMTGFVFWLMQRTTREEVRTQADGKKVVAYRNRILERTGHPYTVTLLQPARSETAFLVEGGDPMNAIYMLLCPEVYRKAGLWDRLLLDSVPSRDVQVRFFWETRLTHEWATQRLKQGKPVRIKAFAAGTGLSVILVCDRLLRDGHDPRLIRAVISDRDPAHNKKTIQLIKKLPRLRDLVDQDGSANFGLFAQAEDIFQPSADAEREKPYDVVTAVGILEYFTGHTYKMTEERLGEVAPTGQPAAGDLILAVAKATAPGGHLIANTHRESAATRILEVFGKRFRYRKPENLQSLAATAGFKPVGTPHSGNVYDVAVFEKAM
ncbi:MAG: hypothetical protein WEB60_05325 [Terrimicrobiaceae bacterium]